MLDVFLGWFVIAIPFLLSVGATVLTLRLPRERHYWKFVSGAMVAGVLFSVITYWQQVRAAKLAERTQQQAINDTADKVAKQTTDNVAEAIGRQYSDLIATLTAQNQKLAAQVNAESSDVKAIKRSSFVSGKKAVKVEVENLPYSAGPQSPPPAVHVAAMPVPSQPQNGKHAVQFILTTNQIMNGGNVRVTCENPIKHATSTLAGAGALLSNYSPPFNGNTSWNSGIGTPNWSPNMPLIITLFFDEDDIGMCTFTPLS